MLSDTDQGLDSVLMPLLKGGKVNLSQLGGVEGNELWLDFLQQGLNLPLLPLFSTAVRVCIQAIKVRLSSACECKRRGQRCKCNAWTILKLQQHI